MPTRLLVALALLALAAGLRFVRLGDWPVANDEFYTLIVTDAWVSGDRSDTPTARMSQVLPLSYTLHALNNGLFGRTEFGTRVMPAVFGSLTPCLLFLFLDGTGRARAIAAAVLFAVWPEHLFHSQAARYYAPTVFFATLALGCGALAVRRWSVWWAVGAAAAALSATACHPVTAALLGVIGVGVGAAAVAGRRNPFRLLAVITVGTAAFTAIYFAYLRPLLHGYQQDGSWGYSPARSLLAAVNLLSWPVALLATGGVILFVVERNGENWYWVAVTGALPAVAVALPLVFPTHPAYLLPFAVGAVVAAGHAVAHIYAAVRPAGWLPAGGCALLACLGSLPSVVSHQLDGSRPDLRTATRFVADHRRPDDRLAGVQIDIIKHYTGGEPEVTNLSGPDAVDRLEALTESPGRVWVIVPSGRAGPPEPLLAWLGRNCTHDLRVRQTRFDYLDYRVDVYLYPGRPTGR